MCLHSLWVQVFGVIFTPLSQCSVQTHLGYTEGVPPGAPGLSYLPHGEPTIPAHYCIHTIC